MCVFNKIGFLVLCWQCMSAWHQPLQYKCTETILQFKCTAAVEHLGQAKCVCCKYWQNTPDHSSMTEDTMCCVWVQNKIICCPPTLSIVSCKTHSNAFRTNFIHYSKLNWSPERGGGGHLGKLQLINWIDLLRLFLEGLKININMICIFFLSGRWG